MGAKTFYLYYCLLKAQLKSQMSYKASFLMEIVSYFGANFINICAIYFLFQLFPSIKGFSMGEVFYLYGISFFAFSSAELLGESLERVPELIVSGQLDHYLTKPLSPLVQIMPLSFQLNRLGRILQALVAFALALYFLPGCFSLRALMWCGLSWISAVMVFFALFLIGATLSFWTLKNGDMMNVFTHGGVEVCKYPLTIYRSFMRRFFLYVIPIGFAIYYPSLMVFNKTDPLGHGPYWAYLAPVVSLIFLGLALQFWKIGMKHYQGAGS